MIREKTDCEEHSAHCLEVPELQRLQYFYGQMLGPGDFRTEQTYFREKLKLHNRSLHGYGTVCGLEVVPVPVQKDCDPPGPGERARAEREMDDLRREIGRTPEEGRAELEARHEELEHRLRCLPKDDCRPAPRTFVLVRCGLAYDCEGNELIVRRDLPVDLLAHLPPEEARRVEKGERPDVTLWVSLCFCEQPVDPVRPVLPDACGAASDCVFGKVRESVRVRVSLKEPHEDDRCETCCSACADPCVLLARIDCFVPGKPAEQIDNGVRRPIGTYVPTRIAGVSWSHGAEYTEEQVEEMTRNGLEIRFTRPVHVSSIQRGVVDLWMIAGGRGSRGQIINWEVEILPSTESMTKKLIFKYRGDDSPSLGDRFLIVVRTSFLLDACCRPVDGDHVGGRVPILADPKYERYRRRPERPGECPRPFGSFGPWQSGNGTPGGTFESWFYVAQDKRYGEKP